PLRLPPSSTLFPYTTLFRSIPPLTPHSSLLTAFLAEHIDSVGQAASAEAVVNVHHTHAGRAGIEHGQQGGQSPETRTVAPAGRHRHHWPIHEAAHHTAQHPIHPCHDHQHARL